LRVIYVRMPDPIPGVGNRSMDHEAGKTCLNLLVPRRKRARHSQPALLAALRVGVAHVLGKLGGDLVYMLEPDDRVRDSRFRAELQRAVGDLLRKIATR